MHSPKIGHTAMFVIHTLTDVRSKKTYKNSVPIYSLCFVTFSATRFNFPLWRFQMPILAYFFWCIIYFRLFDSFLFTLIILWPATQAMLNPQPPYHPHCFPGDIQGHFGWAFHSFGKDDVQFWDPQALAPDLVCHFNLKTVALYKTWAL